MDRTHRTGARWSAVTALILCAGLAAQTPPTGEPKPVVKPRTGRERIEREVEERTKRFREGRIVKSHVRVTIHLVNGNRLAGVVKNGRFVERHDGLRFTQAAAGEADVGIRLWYSDQTNSYIFLPFRSIKRYRIGERLTDQQVKELGTAFQKAAEERAAKARDRALRKGEPTPDGDKPAGAEAKGDEKGGEKKPEGPELTAKQKELLEAYPPAEGWGEAKLKELERRQIVIGVFPNAVEKRFIENFAEWTEAVRVQEEIEAFEAAQRPGAGTPGSTPGRVGPPLPTPAKGAGGSPPVPPGVRTPPGGLPGAGGRVGPTGTGSSRTGTTRR